MQVGMVVWSIVVDVVGEGEDMGRTPCSRFAAGFGCWMGTGRKGGMGHVMGMGHVLGSE